MPEPVRGVDALFLEVMLGLPRQGPGSRACAERALAMCAGLPAAPRVLDLGCGAGGQTLMLAELVPGASIVAIDAVAPAIEQLRRAVVERGLADRVEARVGDLLASDEPAARADLVWSEGALYSVGLERALPVCRSLLRPGGYLAFTDAVWRVDDPPEAVREAFADYPTMGNVDDLRGAVARAGLDRVDDFFLPEAAWWDDFYGPMERRIAALREAHGDDLNMLAALDELAREPALRRRHGETYGYVFVVAERP